MKFGVTGYRLYTVSETIFVVWKMESVQIGRGAPAKTSMKHPEAEYDMVLRQSSVLGSGTKSSFGVVII
jgi:hypothetical protein